MFNSSGARYLDEIPNTIYETTSIYLVENVNEFIKKWITSGFLTI
jgi:hypothetical protein